MSGFDSAFFHQSENACASAKNWSARAWLTPGLPLRSASAPRQAMMSLITALVDSSRAESAGTIPSPLNWVCVNIFAVSAVSSIVMTVASLFPRVDRMWRADASNCWPSGEVSLMAPSGNAGEDLSRSSGFFSKPQTHLAAAMSSRGRMRPSLSESMSASVRESNSSPVVGQASATQSF